MSSVEIAETSRPFIHGYGEHRFRIGDEVHSGSVIVISENVIPWPVGDSAGISLESLAPVTSADPRPQILFVGCGKRFTAPPKDLGDALSDIGISLEWMDTGAACRTYNVVASEDRAVAVALIAVE